MKHAGEAALAAIASLLMELRRLDGLREPRPGVFYRKSSAFLHFHEDPAGMFADVRGSEGWVRMPVNSATERSTFLRQVEKAASDQRGAGQDGSSQAGSNHLTR